MNVTSRDIHDYVTWTTKLILMMQRGFELIHNPSYMVVAHLTGTMH